MRSSLPAILVIFILANPFYGSIDLVTVPVREAIQLTIYNSADITMVRDKRKLTFKPGLNRVKFSWANTLIDPTSLRIKIFNQEKVELIDTTFLANEKTSLIWNIHSTLSGAAMVEISYFTSGISWQANYDVIVNEKESEAHLKAYLNIINKSGETFSNAQVRVVVGYIHLVEDIKKLAQGYETKYNDLKDEDRTAVRRKFSEKIAEAEKNHDDYQSEKPKAVIKEGLSEYFIFSIAGREEIRNGWHKQLKAIEATKLPIKVIYRLSDLKTNSRVMKFYEFKNSHKGKTAALSLGQSPLPNGNYQVFRQGRQGLAYEARARQKYVASGDKVKLNLGLSGAIRLERVLFDYRRRDFKFETPFGSNTPYVKSYVESFMYQVKISNTLKKSVLIEVERAQAKNFSLTKANFKADKISQLVFRYYPQLGAGQSKKYSYQINVLHKGK